MVSIRVGVQSQESHQPMHELPLHAAINGFTVEKEIYGFTVVQIIN
jgi:hypothetical protein